MRAVDHTSLQIEAERQKGGLYVDIKRTEENRESC